MKTFLVFFLCALFSIIKTDRLENDSKEISNTIESRSSLFPKNNIKFTVKPHKTELDTISKVKDSETKKPLMVKLIPKTKIADVTKTVTRKPLMKVRNHTVKPLKKEATEKLHKQDNVHKTFRSFEVNDKPDIKKFIIQNTKIYESSLSKGNGNSIPSSNIKNKAQMHKAIEFSEEEEQDRREFIFIEKSTIKNGLIHATKVNFQTTNDAKKINRRHKRYSNIIEEENMGTTVSRLKFTGHDSRLTNDLYFKNINH